MAQGTGDDRLDAAPSPEELKGRMKETRRALTEKLDALKERVLGIPSSATGRGGKNVPAKKASGRSKASTAKAGKKGSARKAAAKKSAASGAKGKKGAGSKKTAKRTSLKVGKKVKKVVGDVLTAAAAGAVKGAVTAAIPPVKEAAGVTEETPQTKRSSKK